ncbi:hypothetical protein HOG48_06590 [Candidatus Peregrinibacteria bacterium]|jgi:hypothetical protein|nr:hypothetical protein [Candidatus Peregrinibacteria bacterium]
MARKKTTKTRRRPRKPTPEETFNEVYRKNRAIDIMPSIGEERELAAMRRAISLGISNVRRKIRLSFFQDLRRRVENEPLLDIFAGEAAVTYALVISGAIPSAILLDEEDFYEEKYLLTTEALGLRGKVEFKRQSIHPAKIRNLTHDQHGRINKQFVLEMESRARTVIPDTRQAAMISTGLCFPKNLRTPPDPTPKEFAITMAIGGIEKFIEEQGDLLSLLHIRSVELGDVLKALSGTERRLFLIDRPYILVPNAEEITREYLARQIENSGNEWRLASFENIGNKGDAIIELVHP